MAQDENSTTQNITTQNMTSLQKPAYIEYNPAEESICGLCLRVVPLHSAHACDKKPEHTEYGWFDGNQADEEICELAPWVMESAKALLQLDANGKLVPHGIGNLARGIISEFMRVHARGEAFPDEQCVKQGQTTDGSGHMSDSEKPTLRDQFAMAAPIRMMERYFGGMCSAEETIAHMRFNSELRFVWADAMMAARKNPPK